MNGDEVLGVLREIRDEVKQTNGRIDQTNSRLDQTNSRLDQTVVRLDQMSGHLDQTVDRLDQTIGRLDQTNTRLESLGGRVDFLERRLSKGLADVKDGFNELANRQAESEMRLTTEVVSLANVTREVRDLLQQNLGDHKMVIDHE